MSTRARSMLRQTQALVLGKRWLWRMISTERGKGRAVLTQDWRPTYSNRPFSGERVLRAEARRTKRAERNVHIAVYAGGFHPLSMSPSLGEQRSEHLRSLR